MGGGIWNRVGRIVGMCCLEEWIEVGWVVWIGMMLGGLMFRDGRLVEVWRRGGIWWVMGYSGCGGG